MFKRLFGKRKSEQETPSQAQPKTQGQSEKGHDGKKEEGFFARLMTGLSKTRDGFVGKLEQILGAHDKIDDDLYDALEEVLIMADVGVNTTLRLMEDLKEKVREQKISEPAALREVLQESLVELLNTHSAPLAKCDGGTTVYLVVGVNGSGKTTSIGKLACRLKQEGNSVLLCAADTFRAAAIDQLEEWSHRGGVPIIKHQQGADPAAVVYDGVQAAKARGVDYLIVDTAGRLQTQKNLMQELAKIERVLTRELGVGPQEVLLVVDGTTGQNALSQAKLFAQSVNLSGIVLTKLDGTARGGIVISIADELGIPVKLIGVGESMEDLQEFRPDAFVEALFATEKA
ncbi:MAG: signal recognition particle-docking protein FtsY [Limnochordia bacterium]|nr:signal recognition particle-docking protein FtsY [Limnochordia bacterium]